MPLPAHRLGESILLNPEDQFTGGRSKPAQDSDDGVFSALWRTKNKILGIGALVAFTSLGLIAFLRIAIPTMTTDQVAVRFVFPEVQSGNYPNGRNFSIQDIVSPAILQRVYDQNHLAEFGIKLENFESSITAEPFLSTYEFVVGHYRQRLADRKLTFAEIQKLEKDLSAELDSRSRGSALVRMTRSSRFPLPDSLRTKIPSDVIKEWARVNIEELGVLKIPELDERRPIVDPDIDKLDLPIALYVLNTKAREFLDRIATLEKYEGGKSVVDPVSSHSAGSLKRAVTDILNIQLPSVAGLMASTNAVRDREASLSFLKRRSDQLADDLRNAREQAEKQRQALDDYTRARDPGRTSDSSIAANTPASPNFQISDSVLNQILSLSTQLTSDKDERSYRQKMLNTGLEFQKKAVEIEGQIATVRSITDSLTAPAKAIAPAAVERSSDVGPEVLAITSKLNEHWAIARRLYDSLSLKRLSYASGLYEEVAIPASEKSRIEHAVWNATTVLVVALLTLAAMTTAMAWVVFRTMVAAEARRFAGQPN